MEPILKELFEAIVAGKRDIVQERVQGALSEGLSSEIILNQAMLPAMEDVSRLFECGEFYVPEMMMAARAMKAGLSILKPYLVQEKVKAAGKVVIGTVKGDIHDIGKNLVGMMLEGGGFEIIDLGTDVSPQEFVSAALEHKAKIVAMSALLTTTMKNMKTTLEAFESSGVREKVKVMVGGALVSEAFAKDIGADGYAPDASRVIGVAKSLVS